jgi:hypothetical protein
MDTMLSAPAVRKMTWDDIIYLCIQRRFYLLPGRLLRTCTHHPCLYHSCESTARPKRPRHPSTQAPKWQ